MALVLMMKKVTAPGPPAAPRAPEPTSQPPGRPAAVPAVGGAEPPSRAAAAPQR
jgi:hypothetical protein